MTENVSLLTFCPLCPTLTPFRVKLPSFLVSRAPFPIKAHQQHKINATLLYTFGRQAFSFLRFLWHAWIIRSVPRDASLKERHLYRTIPWQSVGICKYLPCLYYILLHVDSLTRFIIDFEPQRKVNLCDYQVPDWRLQWSIGSRLKR